MTENQNVESIGLAVRTSLFVIRTNVVFEYWDENILKGIKILFLTVKDINIPSISKHNVLEIDANFHL